MDDTLWYIHIVENYSVANKNKLLIYKATWMNLKGIMQSERTQSPLFHLCDILEKGKLQ